MRKIVTVFIASLFLIINANADPYVQVTLDNPINQTPGVVVTESNDVILPPEMLSIAVPPVDQEPQPQMLVQPNSEQTPQNKTKEELKKELNVDGAVMVIEEEVVKDLINRITALEVQNYVLQNQLDIISDKLNVSKKTSAAARAATDSNAEMNKGGSASKQSGLSKVGFRNNINKHLLGLKKYMGPNLFRSVIIGIVIILVLLLVSILMPRRRKKVQSINYPKDDLPPQDKEESLDFADDKDKGAAKLNLARAYIEMGHDSKAQSILYEVLASGDDSEKEEAKSLLEKIGKGSQ